VTFAFFLGMVLGFVGSMPVAGPIAILVLGRGLEGRASSGMYLAVGAAIAESAYAYLAFWGFSELLSAYPVVERATRGFAAVLLLALGTHFLRRPTTSTPERPPFPPDPEVGRKRSFVLGLTITALNPTLMVTWTAAVTFAHSLRVLSFEAGRALPFSLGTFAGICLWFALLLWLIGRYRGRFERSTLDRLLRVMGLGLLLLGLFFAVQALWPGAEGA